MSIRLFAACTLFLLASSPAAAEDWPQFRGPAAASAAAGDGYPAEVSPEHHVAWKVELEEQSASSPIVVDGRIFVTASSGVKQDRLHVVCYDAAGGKLLWRRQFWATGRTITHPTSSVAAPTPASDGSRVFAFFSSNDLIALDLAGNLLWYRGLGFDWPQAGNDIGMSSSPVVAGDTVVVQIESQGESFAAGIDAGSGETRWRIERQREANWASPAVMQRGDQSVVVLQSPGGVSGHDVRTGEELWSYSCDCQAISSPVTRGGMLYVAADGLTALRWKERASAPELAWDSQRLGAGASSPAIAGERIFNLNGGVLACGDASSGEEQWKLRLAGRHWATPLVAGGLVYCFNSDGEVHVVRPGEKEGEVVFTGNIGEGVQGSPAAAGGAIFLRSEHHLWKFAR